MKRSLRTTITHSLTRQTERDLFAPSFVDCDFDALRAVATLTNPLTKEQTDYVHQEVIQPYSREYYEAIVRLMQATVDQKLQTRCLLTSGETLVAGVDAIGFSEEDEPYSNCFKFICETDVDATFDGFYPVLFDGSILPRTTFAGGGKGLLKNNIIVVTWTLMV